MDHFSELSNPLFISRTRRHAWSIPFVDLLWMIQWLRLISHPPTFAHVSVRWGWYSSHPHHHVEHAEWNHSRKGKTTSHLWGPWSSENRSSRGRVRLPKKLRSKVCEPEKLRGKVSSLFTTGTHRHAQSLPAIDLLWMIQQLSMISHLPTFAHVSMRWGRYSSCPHCHVEHTEWNRSLKGKTTSCLWGLWSTKNAKVTVKWTNQKSFWFRRLQWFPAFDCSLHQPSLSRCSLKHMPYF